MIRLLQRILRRLLIAFGRIGALFLVLIAVFLAWSWWEDRDLEAFCAAAKAGTPVATLPELAEKYGFSRGWVDRRLPAAGEKASVIYVPRTTSFGEVACAIRHDGAFVSFAEIRGR